MFAFGKLVLQLPMTAPGRKRNSSRFIHTAPLAAFAVAMTRIKPRAPFSGAT
jgi:hypothetical protein